MKCRLVAGQILVQSENIGGHSTRNSALFRFHKNIIIIETYRRLVGDLSETHRRQIYLIGDPSETDMSDRRPMGDRHASLETRRRPTCLSRDQNALSKTHRRPISLIGDQHVSSETHSKTDMSH